MNPHNIKITNMNIFSSKKREKDVNGKNKKTWYFSSIIDTFLAKMSWIKKERGVKGV